MLERKCCSRLDQEQALVDISDALGRLHDIGTAIGAEADAHVVCLEGLDWCNRLETSGRDG